MDYSIVESLTRALNNLVERLHASFFLYLLPEPFQFLTVASYLSAPILVGASLTIAGLRIWHTTSVGSGMPALTAVCWSYFAGLVSFAITGVWVSSAICKVPAC
jgi:TRAP-type C4-dicarboxylate transport system permease small subunit